MTNWLCSREDVKRAGQINGVDRDPMVDRAIEGASRFIDEITRRRFIPETKTRLFRFPGARGRGTVLWVDQDLLSVTTLQSKAQNASPTTIAASDYFLEPANTQNHYNRIEIDLSSSAAFESGDTPQRSISVAGSWGYSNNTRSVGTVASGLASSASATSMVCSNAALIDVGNTLLIESEQIFVTERSNAQVGSETLTGNPTAAQNDVTIGVDDGSNFNAGEVILVDSEKMYIESISGNNLTVIRAYDGSTLAAHTSSTAVQAFRTLTIERGINGTTAATHANSTAVSKYEPEADIRNWCIALALATLHQEQAGWGRTVGTAEGASEFRSVDLANLTKKMAALYKRPRSVNMAI